MRKNTNKKYNRILYGDNRLDSLFKAIGPSLLIFMLAFTTAFLSASVFTPLEETNADSLTVNVASGEYSLTLSSAQDGEINMDLFATPEGAISIAHDKLTVKTNSPSGYKLYLSMDNNDENGNRLYLDGNSSSGSYIAPTSGTFANPAALSDNSWGVAFPKNSTNIIENSFSATYVDSAGNSSGGLTNQSVNGSAKFAQVPLKSNMQLIQGTNSANTVGVNLDMYYGVKANMNLATGTYKGNVLYTAVAEATSNNTGTASVSSASIYADGGAITIFTSLYSNYDFDISDATVKVNGTSCPVTNIEKTSASTVKVTCTAPALSAGTYPVVVNFPHFGKTYTTSIDYDSTANFWNITTMQQMTTAVCNSVYKPTTAIGDAVELVTEKSSYTATSDNTSNQVPQRTLIDARDGNEYRVRKLADGNCYMTENLRLEFDDVDGDSVIGVAHINGDTETEMNSSNTNVDAVVIPKAKTQARYSEETDEEKSAWLVPNKGFTESNVDAWKSRSSRDLRENDYLSSEYTTGENQLYGTYYNLYTAVAGTTSVWNTTENGTLAGGSICPKGWGLATSEFSRLFVNTYHIITEDGEKDDESAHFKILQLPFSINNAGLVNYHGGDTMHKWRNGTLIWYGIINAAQTNANLGTYHSARNLRIYETYFYTSGGDLSEQGGSVRCVAK